MAARAPPQGHAGQRLEVVTIVLGWIGSGWRGKLHRRQFAAQCQLPRAMTVAAETVVADALKAIRQ